MYKRTGRFGLMKRGLAVAVAGAALLWSGLRVRRYRVLTRKTTVPFRLALLSDLHSASYGCGQSELLRKLAAARPDAVLMAGDMAPDRDPLDGLQELLLSLCGRWPLFYVSGNHELRYGREEAVKELMRAFGVFVLEGTTILLHKGEEKISIGGVDDPQADFYSRREGWMGQLYRCERDREEGVFSVLLSHRPEKLPLYASCGFDLALCGHAHGGQVRIPGLVNGLYAPNQGFLPRYAGGFYRKAGTAMVVSRGLARNSLPRVCNPPELVLVDLLPVPLEDRGKASQTGNIG